MQTNYYAIQQWDSIHQTHSWNEYTESIGTNLPNECNNVETNITIFDVMLFLFIYDVILFLIIYFKK